MAKPSARRKAAYWERHLKGESGKGERMNLVINLRAKRAIERLAVCYDVTLKDIVERLAREAQRVTLDKAANPHNGPEGHYDGRLRFGFINVTQ